MAFSGYLSKHLYSRIISAKEEIIAIPLNETELSFLKSFNISFSRVKKTDENNLDVYFLNVNDLKTAFCN